MSVKPKYRGWNQTGLHPFFRGEPSDRPAREVFKEEDLIGNPRSVGVEGCRASCYSSLNCRYWQYLLGQGKRWRAVFQN